MPDTNEDFIKLNLDQARQEYQAQLQVEQEARESEPMIKQMGWGIFSLGIFLIIVQILLAWLADLAGLTGIGLIISVICWVLGALISVILFFLMRPYKDSIKEFKIFYDLSLFFDGIPILDSIPLDLFTWIYAFIKSRSKIIQKVASHIPNALEKIEKVAA